MSMYQDNEGDKTHLMKKNMHLDFGSASTKTKEQKFANMINNPDMNMLKLASPDLEKLIAHNGMVGTTPTPTQFIYPKYVTDEQEAYARGFVEALAELHQTPGVYYYTFSKKIVMFVCVTLATTTNPIVNKSTKLLYIVVLVVVINACTTSSSNR